MADEALHPASPAAELATVLFWQGKQKEALGLIEQLEISALTPEARLAAADMYTARTNYPKAEILYRQHLTDKPDDQATRVKLAILVFWLNKAIFYVYRGINGPLLLTGFPSSRSWLWPEKVNTYKTK
jgi:hypothetical protein